MKALPLATSGLNRATFVGCGRAYRRLCRALAGLSAILVSSALVLSDSSAFETPESPQGTTGTPSYPNLAPTPPMGWNSWLYYGCDVTEKAVLENARALVRSGLAARGYNTVTIDECWMTTKRDRAGDLVANPVKFPHGMPFVARRLHEMGLKFGIYADAGTTTCTKKFPGSVGHFQQDANLFARWGVDYLKLDGCHVPIAPSETKEETFHDVYRQMSQALLNTGRPIVFSVSAPAYFQYDGDSVWRKVIGWSSDIGNLWRSGRDIASERAAPAAKWPSIKYNFDYNSLLADMQKPGRWNDPDFLLAGNSGLTTEEIQSQMALWSVMAAPLISGTDLTKLSPAAFDVLSNREVIAVDQDRLGIQGRIVDKGAGFAVLSKPLANGDRAVALFNSGETERAITTSARAVGLPAARSYLLKDLVTDRVGRVGGTFSARVAPHATKLFRVRALSY